jgi:hypothetical protein
VPEVRGPSRVSTRDDAKHLVSDIGNLASSAWHGITSLF